MGGYSLDLNKVAWRHTQLYRDVINVGSSDCQKENDGMMSTVWHAVESTILIDANVILHVSIAIPTIMIIIFNFDLKNKESDTSCPK